MKYVVAISLILLVIVSSSETPARATTASKSPPVRDNAIHLMGVVDSSYVRRADELLERAATEKVVDIIINSPGGVVLFGNVYINAMEMAKARGTTLRCFVTNLAASMAFQILAHCSERYALANSYLLWHPVRIAGQIELTPQLAVSVAKSLEITEDQLLRDLRKYFRVEDERFFYHYYQESFVPATELLELAPGYLTVVEDMPGIASFSRGTVSASAAAISETVEEVTDSSPLDIIYIIPGYGRTAQ